MSVIARVSSDLTVASSATQTAVLNVAIPGGTLSTDQVIRVRFMADVLQSSGSDASGILRVEYGGQTLYEDTSSTLSTAANKRGLILEAYVCADGTASSQTGGGLVFIKAGAASIGVGDLASGLGSGGPIRFASTTVDSSTQQDLKVTWKWDTASASKSFTRRFATVELVEAVAQDEGTQDLADSTAETAMWTAAIPGESLGDDKMLRFVFIGDLLNNTGGLEAGTLDLKYGGQTLYRDSSASATASANRRPVFIAGMICAQSVSAQAGGGLAAIGNTGGVTTGIGDFGLATSNISGSALSWSETTVDSSDNQNLVLSWKWNTASTNLSFRRRYAFVEVV